MLKCSPKQRVKRDSLSQHEDQAMLFQSYGVEPLWILASVSCSCLTVHPPLTSVFNRALSYSHVIGWLDVCVLTCSWAGLPKKDASWCIYCHNREKFCTLMDLIPQRFLCKRLDLPNLLPLTHYSTWQLADSVALRVWLAGKAVKATHLMGSGSRKALRVK